MLEIALVSREFHPFPGGGLGVYLNALARTLEPVGRVTVLTTDRHEPLYRELTTRGDERLPPAARFVFVPEPTPTEIGPFYSSLHIYSARVFEAMIETFPEGGPDLIEFSDYLGEGFVTIQAARTLSPSLRRTRCVVRVNTSAYLCSLLDGNLGKEHEMEVTHDLERFCLRYADHLLWAGGDILETYERFYGQSELAAATRIRHPLELEGLPSQGERNPPSEDGALRVLYFGRLERRKGVQRLVKAVVSLPRDDVQLTLVGGDTATAPAGSSMRDQLELAAAGDRRITFTQAVPRSQIADLVSSHHATIVPSIWECWPSVALESLSHNRPVIATPTGGLVEIVQPGKSGWLSRDNGVEAIQETIEHVLAHRHEVTEMIASGSPRTIAIQLTDRGEIRRAYRRLLKAPKAVATHTGARPPLVSVIVPYFRLHDYVEEAIASIFAQTWHRLEVIVVNDGSFREADRVLASLAARYPLRVLSQPNQGLGAARNSGIAQSRGSYVLPIDADNTVEPKFISRAVQVLESDPELAYVTCWSRFVDERGVGHLEIGVGYPPLGNYAELLGMRNVAGDAAAVIRRRVFDLGFAYSEEIHTFEDWFLYRELQGAGMYGMVIPEALIRYRVRENSMMQKVGLPREARLREEMEAHLIERRIRWKSVSD